MGGSDSARPARGERAAASHRTSLSGVAVPTAATALRQSLRLARRRLDDVALSLGMTCIRCGVMSPGIVLGVARQLIVRHRYEEADDIVRRGLQAFPDQPDLLLEHAFSAHNSRRHAEAMSRWQRVRERRSDLAMAWYGIASNARESGRIDVAAATIAEALCRFPDHPDVVSEAARIADRRGAAAEAVVLWRRMIDRPSIEPGWLQGYVTNLVLLARFDEAESELDRALALYPGRREFLAVRGMLAMAREDWDGAMAVWRDYRTLHPDDQTGWEHSGRTLAARQFAEVDAPSGPSGPRRPVDVGRIEDEAIRTLLLGFESLGSDCEFGMVQRRYGAEPLGLLRWNAVSPRSLMAALADRFDGMGDPDRTELVVHDGEYVLKDRRWGLAMHTFVLAIQADRDVLLAKMCRRVAYLRNKLLADLQDADKIFVFKSPDIRLDELQALHAGLRTCGPVRLLCVKQANTDRSVAPLCGKRGEVFAIQHDLYVGFIDRLGSTKGYWDIAFDDWLSICRSIPGVPAPGAPHPGFAARPEDISNRQGCA